LKKAQVAPISAMNNGCPLVTLGDNAQKNDPDVSQTSSDHQASQALRVSDVAFVQVKAPAFLVREKGFDTLLTIVRSYSTTPRKTAGFPVIEHPVISGQSLAENPLTTFQRIFHST